MADVQNSLSKDPSELLDGLKNTNLGWHLRLYMFEKNGRSLLFEIGEISDDRLDDEKHLRKIAANIAEGLTKAEFAHLSRNHVVAQNKDATQSARGI